MIDVVGRSVAASLDRALLERIEGFSGTDCDRLARLAEENSFRLQLGKAERGAGNDIEKAVCALFAAEIVGQDSNQLFRRFGLMAIPPRLVNSWSLLELLGATQFIATKTKLQKMLFALQEKLEVDGLTSPRLRFVRYVYGPYASQVDSLVNELTRFDLVTAVPVGSTRRFQITDRGRRFVATLRELAPNYEHLGATAAQVAKRLGGITWSKVKQAAYADPLVRGRTMNDALLPLDRRLARTPGLAPDPGIPSTRAAVEQGNAKALVN